MLNDDFRREMGRIIGTFGKNFYSEERLALIKKALRDVSGQEFTKIVDHMISSFRSSPLPKDFTEAAIQERKKGFDREVRGASQILNTQFNSGLNEYLSREFPGCKTLNEAVAVRSHKIHMAKAEDPTYDPMKDSKWL